MLELKDYTTEELKAELKRRAAEEKPKKKKEEYVMRCRMCKHWGAVDCWGNPINFAVGNYRSCEFHKAKNGNYYKRHRASELACFEHFERKEE